MNETNNEFSNERFFTYFQHELAALQEEINRLADHAANGGERTDAIDHCTAGVTRLSNEVRDISSSLPAYDRQTYSDSIKTLTSRLQAARTQISKKQKFSFKNSAFKVQKNESAISLHDAAELASRRRADEGKTSGDSSFATTPLPPGSPAMEAAEQSMASSLSNRHDQLVLLEPSHEQSLSVSSIDRSLLDLKRNAREVSTMRFVDISSSIVICPDISGPIHLTRLRDCIVLVRSRQFRMHESTNCTVYLDCASRPIIEDCKDIRFAPNTTSSSDNSKTENKWDQVDDFKWLQAEQSPNWSVLSEPSRLENAFWAHLSDVKDDPSVKTILGDVKLVD